MTHMNANALARLSSVTISPLASIKEAIAVLDKAGTGALIVCEEDGALYGLLTDGDIRRAILANKPLDGPCGAIATREPLAVPDTILPEQALHLMDHARDYLLNQLPLLSKEGRVTGLLLRSDLMADVRLPMSAVIMAGGFGTRMRPLTDAVPKPMLPVGDRPLLHTTMERLRKAGINRIHVTTHYLPDTITGYFGDGHDFGLEINYVLEDKPLGTAGALTLVEKTDEPLLVLNGDILTGVDFTAMMAYHRKHKPSMTVGVRQYTVQLPYGVVDCEDIQVVALREKPTQNFLVNAGIYLLEPSAHHLIPADSRFDMTDLIERLLSEKMKVISFPIVEYWLDIGQHEDYEKAQADVASGTYSRG